VADEEIRIDYITTYITNKHGEWLRNSETFNKKLREQAFVTKKGEASLASYRKEIERTSPEVAKAARELDRLHKIEARGVTLTNAQKRARQNALAVLKNERNELRMMAREREREIRAQIDAERDLAKEAEKAAKARTQAEREAARERERANREAETRRRIEINKSSHAINNLIRDIDHLGDAHIRNARKHDIWRRKIDEITLRSTRRAISGVHEWTTTLASMALPAIPQFLSLLAGALGTVGTAAVGAASSLAKLGPGIGAVGGAIAGVVQTMGVWKLAMRDMDKLFESAMFDNLADFTKTLKDFTPAAQEFALTMRQKVRPALTEWQKIAQGNIFGGINRGVNALLPRRGLITDIVRQTSAALGTGIGNFGQELASPEWARAFREIGSSNAQNIRTLTAAAIPLSRALRDIVVAGQPILDWAVQATAKTAKVFEQWIAGKKASGELASGVEGARKRLEDFVDIGASWGSTIMSVLKAGQSTGDMITKGLRDNANAMQEWTKSFEGQRRMTEFFKNMQPAVKESALLVRDLGVALAHTAEQSSFDVLIHQLRADLLPTLEQTMIQVNRQMGPLLIETVVNVLQAFTVAMGPNGPVSLLVNGVNQLAQAFTRLSQIPLAGTLLRWTIGMTALWRVARLTGAVVGGRVLFDTIRAGRGRQQQMLERLEMQGRIRAAIPTAFPDAMMQPMGRRPGGRFGFIPGPKVIDESRLPANVREALQPLPPTLMERLRSGNLREDFRAFRAQNMGRVRAGFETFRPNLRGVGGGLMTGGILLGGLAAQQGASAAGLSSRAQNIIGMGATGAGLGAMIGTGVGGPGLGTAVGAGIGAVAGGLTGLAVSFLSAKPKVDEFAESLQKATTGLAATRETVANMRQNQRQLQLGVRSGQLELNAAVQARDRLTRGMTDREAAKFERTDVFKQAQLRVDVARTNLRDMQNALDKNTEQLRIANERLKQDMRRPRNYLQTVAGEFGGRLSAVNASIARVRVGGVQEGAEQRRLNQLLAERRKIITEFAQRMTDASRKAAENGQPFFARMFANAMAKAMNDGRIEAGFTRVVTRATRRGVVFNRPGSRANPESRDFPGRAGGGRITWGNSGSDSAPAMLAKGEFVVTGGGEQMLEAMTFPGVLNWLEGAQPAHFMRGGRVRGRGDMDDRRKNDPTTWQPWMAMVVGEDGRPPVYFPADSELGQLQRAMGVQPRRANRRARRGGRFQDGGFFRRGILAQFQGSFSSGFSAGASKQPDAIASLFASTVQAGQFEAISKDTGGADGKGKNKDFQGNLKKAGPRVRAVYRQVKSLVGGKIPYVPGGGHSGSPGPSKPDPGTLYAMGVVKSMKAARMLAKEYPRGLDHAGFVRTALARGGMRDPGQRPQNLLGWGKEGVGNWLTVYALPPTANRAYMNVAGTEFGYYGRDPNFTLGSHARVSRGSQGFAARSFGNFRRGGRVGMRRYQTGGRITMPNLNPGVGGAIAMPALTGAGGQAANRAWAQGVAGYLQSLTTASIGNITSAINSLGSQVVSMTANADTSPAAQNLLSRVSALLDAAEFALGERLGRAQAAIEDMANQTVLRRTRLDRFQREREIDPGSARGLRQELGQLRFENFGRFGLQAQIRAQRGLVAAAAGTQEQQQLQDRLDELISQAAENLTQRVITRRAIARARFQQPVDRLGNTIDTRNFELQRLTLRQQIAGTAGTPAGNAQLQNFLKTQLLPAQIAREKAANRAMVKERQRSGRDSEAFRQAQQQWQQAVLDRLDTQNQLGEKNNQDTEKVARALSGQLSFDFMGQGFTDAINAGVGV
jgi:hypothetical protein